MPQEIKKIPIVIASILKPIDDTRMFEKLGHSIGKETNIDITIIGYPTRNTHLPATFNFIPFKPFNRLSLKRIFVRFDFLKQVVAIKPAIVILTTHELLFVSVLAKWITGCRLIYDIQENYYRNIIHSTTFPGFIKEWVAMLVRLKEKLLSRSINHFFLAEASYQHELTFLQNRFTVLQNKASKVAIDQSSFQKKSAIDGNIHLLFSGTLATSTGIFEAIRWTKSFYEVNNSIRLTIIGYCAIPKALVAIKNEIKDYNFIKLIGGDELVPHTRVLEEISKSDAGFITYIPDASTSGSIPTKLFEYLAFKLPIFLVPYQPWVDYCELYDAAILLEKSFPAHQLLNKFKEHHFYKEAPPDVFWEDQEASLSNIIRAFLPKS